MKFEIIEIVITSITSSSALIWILRGWISERLKKSIEHEYSLKLETHKAILKSEYESSLVQLKSHHEIQLENLKYEFLVKHTEKSVIFEKVFERLLESLEGILTRIKIITKQLSYYNTLAQYSNLLSVEEYTSKIPGMIKDLEEFVEPRQLFLPKELSVKIRRAITKFNIVNMAINESVKHQDLAPLKEASNEVTSLLIELEEGILFEARSMLGVETKREWEKKANR